MTDANSTPLGLRRGQVRLVNSDVHWARLFDEEAGLLNSALSGFGAVVEHCGSTSIPGMPAKPILDILVGIPEPIDVLSVAGALEPLGYEHATWAGVPGHEVFGKGDPRTHLIHVVPTGGPAWRRMLCFRDMLRGDPRLAVEYADLKRDLAERYASDRSAYTEAKGAFIASLVDTRT